MCLWINWRVFFCSERPASRHQTPCREITGVQAEANFSTTFRSHILVLSEQMAYTGCAADHRARPAMGRAWGNDAVERPIVTAQRWVKAFTTWLSRNDRSFILGLCSGPTEVLYMCRNIKPLFNFEPPAQDDEIRAAAVQYVRKISGFNQPSKANEAAFQAAVEAVAAATSTLLRALETHAPARDRETEIARARARNARRFPDTRQEP